MINTDFGLHEIQTLSAPTSYLPPAISDAFNGNSNSFIDGLTSAVDTGLDLALKWELFRQERDSKGQGQSDVVNAITKDSQAVNAGGSSGAGSPQLVAGVDNKMLIIGGLVIIGALVVIKV